MNQALIVGFGDIGRRIGAQLGGQVPLLGLCRSRQADAHSDPVQIRLLNQDLDSGPLRIPEAGGAEVYYLCPPPSSGIRDPRIENFMAACGAALPRRIVYISTSGVYGDCGGAWVTEDRLPRPLTERAKRRHHAEQSLFSWARARGVETVILRVGGIYGPGRLPRSRIANMIVICPDQAPYSNRIHAHDLARVCIAAMRNAPPGAIYNVSDGHPTTMTDYLYRVADRFGLMRPRCVDLARAPELLSPAMLSFVRESRRLDITKMQRDLGVELRYPTLEAGLSAC